MEMEDIPCSSDGKTSQEETNSRSEACGNHNNDAKEKRLMARIDAQTSGEEEEEHGDDSHEQNSKKVAFMITITFLFFLVELIVGFTNRSIALLADSYHMLSDVMALTVAFICLRISRRKSKRNGFGWVRAEVLGALVNGVFLLAMCFTISLESIGRLLHPKPMSHPLQVLGVGIVGLLINLVGIGMFHGGHGHSHGGGGHGHSHGGGGKKNSESGHGHSHNGNGHGHSHNGHGHSHENGHEEEHEEEDIQPTRPARSLSHLSNECSHNHLALRLVNLDETSIEEEFDDDSTAKRQRKMKEAENLNMRGVLLHIISDAIGSVFVIITASLAYFVPDQMGSVINYLDPALSLCLVTLICISAYRLVQETAAIVLARPPSFVDMDDLRADIQKISGVASVRDLSAWTLVANRHLATAHVEFCSPAAFDRATPKIRKLFHGIGIHSLTLQPSFSSIACLSTRDPVPMGDIKEIDDEEQVDDIVEQIATVSDAADIPLLEKKATD